jgi:hypothetical protein
MNHPMHVASEWIPLPGHDDVRVGSFQMSLQRYKPGLVWAGLTVNTAMLVLRMGWWQPCLELLTYLRTGSAFEDWGFCIGSRGSTDFAMGLIGIYNKSLS